MQNVIIYLALLFTVMATQGQSKPVAQAESAIPTQYEKGMREAFQLWQDKQPWEAANLFERIAKAEPDNWLPPYYVAQINVINSFGEKDKSKLAELLGKAQSFIDDAMAISKDNPELLVLQAQLYTSWIIFDGQHYGMLYSPKATSLYEKALKIQPENPRMILAQAEWNIGSAKYFNQPIDMYCKEVQRAIELFATFKPKGEFYPSYGLERAKEVVLENCQ